LPSGGAHWTRNVRFGPDGLLYVSIGSDCNACIEDDPRRAAVLRFQPDGSGQELFATGLRNAVGLDWQPSSGDLYATDNGRDLLGDDFPPCELNRLVAGEFYGWPFANGNRIPDPDQGEGRSDEIAASLPPVHAFRAHNAPLGITFVRGTALPAPYHGAAIVALHGSWNRTHKDGYSVVSLHFGPDGVEERDLVSGFELDGDVIGRPVDVAEGPDGALYISDDYGGAVYRLAFGEESGTTMQARATKPAVGNAAPLASLADGERQQLAERGAALYAEHGCAGCHETGAGPEGMVVKPLHELSSRHDLEGLTAFLAAPTPPMPAVALDDAGRRSLAVHLLSRHP
ncbi:MAG: PQQ-dependent sugar dehydrogenase, partial [Deltaproteobacteria bacterium]|nr:PQQ-dependent sugar dehydrogenase [Deltaproteobacteria bacterium]